MLETISAIDPVTIGAFLAAAILLNLTPGSDVMFTLASSLSGGIRAGVSAAAGITVGSLVHVILAAAGVAALLKAYPAAFEAIRYVGAAYLLYLAWQSWTAAGTAMRGNGQSGLVRAFLRGFITNILNPKVALFIVAFLPQFTDPAIGPVWQQILVLGGLFAASGLIVTTLYGLFAGLLADRLKSASNYFNKISALVFGGLAARLVLD